MIPRQPRRLMVSTGWSGPFACSCTWTARFRVLRPPFSLRHQPRRPLFSGQDMFPFEFAPNGSPNHRSNGQMFALRQSRQAGDQVRIHGIRLERACTFGSRRQCDVECDMALTCQSSESGALRCTGLTTDMFQQVERSETSVKTVRNVAHFASLEMSPWL